MSAQGSAEELTESVRADGLLAPGRRVLVLFSGGQDSTCLLDVAVRIAGREAVGALHVNTAVQVIAALTTKTSPHLAHCRGHLVPLPLWVERPGEARRLRADDLRPEARQHRTRRHDFCTHSPVRGDEFADEVIGTIGDHERALRIEGEAGRVVEARRGPPVTVGEA